MTTQTARPSFIARAAAFLAVAFLVVAAPPPAGARERTLWPHEVSDLKPDPGVRYGALPNGMRYAIMRNTQPSGIASIRLRFGAGSLNETETTQGIAHFLEHMAFNGSQNLPEGEMVKVLQRAGLAFGPDTNASTAFDETIYMLDLPHTDPATLETGFSIMRETAGRLLLAQDSIDRERGVILSEERSRDSPEYRALKDRFGFWLKGQPLVTRWPIGRQETIRSVRSEDFRAFYQANYRPEKALLVVVGDIDSAAIEAKIREKFADWTQPGAAAPDPTYGVVARRGLEADHHVEPGLPASVSVSWMSPPDTGPDTAARERLEMVRSVGYAVVNRRLERLARKADAPFISADVSRSRIEKSANIAILDVSVRPGQWREGLAAGEQELRRALQYGVTQAEVDREIAELMAGYQQSAQGAQTRDTRALANIIPSAFSEGEVFVHPSTALELFTAASKGLTAQRVTAALREVFRGQGPLVYVSGSEPIEGGDAAILAAYRASAATPVARPQAETETAFAYTDFGPIGVIAEQTHNEEFDLDLVRFANGVRLTVKRTPFQEKTINVTVRLPGGVASSASTKPGLSILSPFVMGEAGLGRMTTEELERATAGRVLGASFNFGEDDFTYSGRTRPEDLLLQTEVLAAFVTDPGFRPDGLKRLQQAAENFIRQYSTAPDRVLDRDSGALLRRNDVRWAFPTLEQVQALTMDDFRGEIGDALKTRPIEISIVGDIEPEKAIRAVAQTFGALPPRADASPAVRPIAFPPGTATPVRLTHEGRADQGGAMIAWPAADFSNARKARAVRLARLILDDRLTEEYREALGASYSPQTGEDLSQTFEGYGYVAAIVETPPADIPKFFETVDKITAEIREGRISDDTIARARLPAIDGLRTSERGNGYWVAVLADAQTNPRRFMLMRTRITDLEAITKAEIIAAARETFDNAKAVRIVVTPKAQ